MTIQRQVQRRQILSMIGVTPWVSRKALTHDVQELMATLDADAQPLDTHQASPTKAANSEPIPSATDSLSAPTHGADYENNYADNQISASANVVISDDSAAYPNALTTDNENHVSVSAPSALEPVVSGETFNDEFSDDEDDDGADVEVAIEPFTLQGLSYNDWVLLVDVANLSSPAQKLWQNMQIGLSTTVEQLAFPFCKSMSTLDMANASLAGFVFKLGHSEHIQVAALTDLPEGLDHALMVRTPLLEEMLSEPAYKKQLWQLLSG